MNANDNANNPTNGCAEEVHQLEDEGGGGLNRRTIDVRLDEFKGGVGLWGAVPACYDTTRLPMDRGIHVHARCISGKVKNIDKSYSAVRILSDRLPKDGIIVSEFEAIYYMVSTVFGIVPQNIMCPKCEWPHLDQDWYSVHPHREHNCAKCGELFKTSEPAVGNPIVTVREVCRVPQQQIVYSSKKLEIRQNQYQNGLLIWGSNPAFLWTGQHAEQEGMHVHVFDKSAAAPKLDETYGIVRIDGIEIDPQMVRLLMAQQSLPMLRDRIAAISCPECKTSQFDVGENSYTPTKFRTCTKCSHIFSMEKEAISNPVLATFSDMAAFAQRPPQKYVLDLPRYQPAAA